MKKARWIGMAVSLFVFLSFFFVSAQAQTQKPTKPVTLTFNWEGAYGRANCLVWPFRPGGSFEQFVTKHTEGLVKLDIKEKLYGIMESVFAIGDGRIQMGTQSIPAATGTYPLLDFGGIPGFFADPPQGAYQWAEAFVDPKMMAVWDKYSKPAGFKILGGIDQPGQQRPVGKQSDQDSGRFQGGKSENLWAHPDLGPKSARRAARSLFPWPKWKTPFIRGTVDAICTSKSYGAERGLIDLCKFASIWPVTPVFSQFIAVNAKVWDKLPSFSAGGTDEGGGAVDAGDGSGRGTDGNFLHPLDPRQ